MERKDREVKNLEEILKIMKKCDVCSLALFDEQYPYIVPLNFGISYDGTNIILYFHGANRGKKLSLIQRNNHVSFAMTTSHNLIAGKAACDYTMEYESVVGSGKIEMLDESQKIDALSNIMKNYSENDVFEFDEKYLQAVAVYKLTVQHITGKRLKR
jgi:nitroimidazol reductase NimA-like FMN-containing flavoprotein (pyridoxamine 5'-phosphate oxidase superfamily)